jgi:hypothetical protein
LFDARGGDLPGRPSSRQVQNRAVAQPLSDGQ